MKILHLAFNYQATHLTVATDTGFIIYKLIPEIERKIFTELHAGVALMKLLNATNMSALVGGGDNPFRTKNTVAVWDDHKKSSVLEIEFQQPVNNVHLTPNHLIAVTERKIHLCKLSSGEFIDTIDTYANDRKLCEISYPDNSSEPPIVVTLGKKKGEIAVWSPTDDSYKAIQAHENNLSSITVNRDGTLIATASETGTNIHVYCVKTGKLLHKLRRGTTKAKIFNISINNTHVACCSSNGTIHIFDISANSQNVQSSLSFIKNFLPEYFSSQWSFQQIHLDDTSQSVCSFDKFGNLNVVTYDGFYYKIPKSSGRYDGEFTRSTINL